MAVHERALARLLETNNRCVRSSVAAAANPVPTEMPWQRELATQWAMVRSEWDQFAECGGRLPLIEDLISESQGNEGPWRAGLLVSRGRACGIAPRFPRTVEALGLVPGLRSALWSLLEPGTELPVHTGPNAGVLRYHLGVRCEAGAALLVGSTVVEYVEGRSVLFDDTAPHAAWNRSGSDRVTLFCEVERTLPRPAAMLNRCTQTVLALDRRYRHAPARAEEWDRALNPGSPASIREGWGSIARTEHRAVR